MWFRKMFRAVLVYILLPQVININAFAFITENSSLDMLKGFDKSTQDQLGVRENLIRHRRQRKQSKLKETIGKWRQTKRDRNTKKANDSNPVSGSWEEAPQLKFESNTRRGRRIGDEEANAEVNKKVPLNSLHKNRSIKTDSRINKGSKSPWAGKGTKRERDEVKTLEYNTLEQKLFGSSLRGRSYPLVPANIEQQPLLQTSDSVSTFVNIPSSDTSSQHLKNEPNNHVLKEVTLLEPLHTDQSSNSVSTSVKTRSSFSSHQHPEYEPTNRAIKELTQLEPFHTNPSSNSASTSIKTHASFSSHQHPKNEPGKHAMKEITLSEPFLTNPIEYFAPINDFNTRQSTFRTSGNALDDKHIPRVRACDPLPFPEKPVMHPIRNQQSPIAPATDKMKNARSGWSLAAHSSGLKSSSDDSDQENLHTGIKNLKTAGLDLVQLSAMSQLDPVLGGPQVESEIFVGQPGPPIIVKHYAKPVVWERAETPVVIDLHQKAIVNNHKNSPVIIDHYLPPDIIELHETSQFSQPAA